MLLNEWMLQRWGVVWEGGSALQKPRSSEHCSRRNVLHARKLQKRPGSGPARFLHGYRCTLEKPAVQSNACTCSCGLMGNGCGLLTYMWSLGDLSEIGDVAKISSYSDAESEHDPDLWQQVCRAAGRRDVSVDTGCTLVSEFQGKQMWKSWLFSEKVPVFFRPERLKIYFVSGTTISFIWGIFVLHKSTQRMKICLKLRSNFSQQALRHPDIYVNLLWSKIVNPIFFLQHCLILQGAGICSPSEASKGGKVEQPVSSSLMTSVLPPCNQGLQKQEECVEFYKCSTKLICHRDD